MIGLDGYIKNKQKGSTKPHSGCPEVTINVPANCRSRVYHRGCRATSVSGDATAVSRDNDVCSAALHRQDP